MPQYTYPLPYPHPRCATSLSSETTANIADSVKTDVEILAAAGGTTAEKLYKCVDLHMTDGTQDNKGFAKACAEIIDREDVAGQFFCTCFFCKHNVYRHTEAQISKKLSIF